MIICSFCGCDIDAMGQDNMSCNLDESMCEDCWRERKKEVPKRNAGEVRP